MGRPKGSIKTLDLKQIEGMAAIGCTQDEIGIILGFNARMFHGKRADVRAAYQAGAAKMRASLRRLQWGKAKEGNVTMMIWLGKQILGQKDRMEETIREEVVEIQRIEKKRAIGND